MGTARKSYLMTLTAEEDFRLAHKWSKQRWGAEKTRSYFQDLHDGANDLALNWKSKSNRKLLLGDLDFKVHAVREHYLIYVPWDGVTADIILVALIRQGRDVPQILKANNFLIRRELSELKASLYLS